MECPLIRIFLAQQPRFDGPTWIALSLAVLAVAYVMLRAKAKRDPLERTSARHEPIGLAHRRETERHMQGMLVELSDMARTMSAGLDTRAAKLEALIDQADRRIEELHRAAEQLSAIADSVRGVASAASSPTTAGLRDANSAVAPTPAGPSEPVAALPGAAVATALSLSPPQEDARHARVYELAERGQSPAQIAATLDRPSGEIELILALRPASRSSGEIDSSSAARV